ncbi:MAG: deoxyribose-phosphate aldolase [Gaiellaceae bacterium]
MTDETFSVETLSVEQVAKTIDHSLLRPELTTDEVGAGCELARAFNVASVCAKPCDVALVAELLTGSEVKASTVIGFPHGSSSSVVKAFEAERAIEDGAEELDMVLNVGRLRSGAADDVVADIQAVVDVAAGRALVKVILENAYLDEEQKVLGCRLAEQAGADFVKTSTGFAPSGATLDDLRLMRKTVSPGIGVKAAGGIRSLDALIDALNAGASRVGATATKAILEELAARKARI